MLNFKKAIIIVLGMGSLVACRQDGDVSALSSDPSFSMLADTIDSTIPLHFIWLGKKPMTPEYYRNIARWMQGTGHKSPTTLWVDQESEPMIKKALEDELISARLRTPQFQLRSIDELFEELGTREPHRKADIAFLELLLKYDSVGRLNQAARSDILRFLVLYLYGGIYSDVDNYYDYDAKAEQRAPLSLGGRQQTLPRLTSSEHLSLRAKKLSMIASAEDPDKIYIPRFATIGDREIINNSVIYAPRAHNPNVLAKLFRAMMKRAAFLALPSAVAEGLTLKHYHKRIAIDAAPPEEAIVLRRELMAEVEKELLATPRMSAARKARLTILFSVLDQELKAILSSVIAADHDPAADMDALSADAVDIRGKQRFAGTIFTSGPSHLAMESQADIVYLKGSIPSRGQYRIELPGEIIIKDGQDAAWTVEGDPHYVPSKADHLRQRRSYSLPPPSKVD